MTDYVFTMTIGPICWRSILQNIVALSTTEDEFMTAIEVVKEVIGLEGLLIILELGKIQLECFVTT